MNSKLKILLAPNAFKGVFSPLEIIKIVGNVFNKKGFEIISIPIADGGDGTIECLANSTQGEILIDRVKGPLGKELDAQSLLIDNKIAVIEMAQSAGLALVSPTPELPLKSSTYGVGQQILNALDLRIQKLYIGIGGSCTNDAGAGMLAALGVKFFIGDDIVEYPNGEVLLRVEKIDFSGLDPRLKKVSLKVLCDVENPLFGKEGPAYVYGLQKIGDVSESVKEEMFARMDSILVHFSKLTNGDAFLPGSGAAGGLGYGLSLIGGELVSGIDEVLDITNYDEKLKDVDLIITGEGRVDSQMLYGKGPLGILKRSKGKPVILISGQSLVSKEEVKEAGFKDLFSICEDLDISPKEAMSSKAEYYLEKLSYLLTNKIMESIA